MWYASVSGVVLPNQLPKTVSSKESGSISFTPL